jgi:hypothetical protein
VDPASVEVNWKVAEALLDNFGGPEEVMVVSGAVASRGVACAPSLADQLSPSSPAKVGERPFYEVG